MTGIYMIGSLLIVLGVLIFVHELGHFLAAKAAGVHVHRFSLGLGAPIRALTFVRGGTEYSVSWIPLGGYVKMASVEEEATSSVLEGGRPAREVPRDRVFEAKPVWVRMLIILAGVTMNALFAWAVFTYLAAKNGRQIEPGTTVGRVVEQALPRGAEALAQLRAGDRIVAIDGRTVASWDEVERGIATGSGDEIRIRLADGREIVVPIHADALEDRLRASQAIEPYRAPVIGQLEPGRPADRAGLRIGDTVVAAAGDTVRHWGELVGVLERHPGRPLTLAVRRDGARLELEVTPESQMLSLPDGRAKRVGRIGVGLARPTVSEPYTFPQAVVAGLEATVDASTQIVRSVRGMLTGRVSTRDVGGPILIGQLAAQSARLGLDTFLGFMALISVNLAVLNLLPIPILDGGQFLFLLAEAVNRRPLSLRLRERLTMVGLVLIVMLMLLAFSNDIRRVLGL
ncbi:MAG TPA: RIP metalloprotease RseP [Gemmatimonadales bacterium]|nr:RIP metalloprotease RseP [Gemmatimonadales bacterium]